MRRSCCRHRLRCAIGLGSLLFSLLLLKPFDYATVYSNVQTDASTSCVPLTGPVCCSTATLMAHVQCNVCDKGSCCRTENKRIQSEYKRIQDGASHVVAAVDVHDRTTVRQVEPRRRNGASPDLPWLDMPQPVRETPRSIRPLSLRFVQFVLTTQSGLQRNGVLSEVLLLRAPTMKKPPLAAASSRSDASSSEERPISRVVRLWKCSHDALSCRELHELCTVKLSGNPQTDRKIHSFVDSIRFYSSELL